MDKQIEEMADALYNSQYEYDLSNPFEVAKVVIDLGYRKIPENGVVLTGEEYELLTNDLDKTDYGDFENGYRQGYQQGSKDTAEKFAERLKEALRYVDCSDKEHYAFRGKIDEICKEMVEGK